MQIKTVVKKLIPNFLLSWYHWLWALGGALVFGFPGRKLTVIGVTGTSGKSTTVDFITKILEEAGNSVASLSSVRFKVGKKEWKNELKMTMPGRFIIQNFLKRAVKEHCKYAVLEVTSEGVKQYRHKFIHFDTVVFTNLSKEHIESHGGFENYRNEKLKLFKASKNVHVINRDDENAKYFLDIPAKKSIVFGIKNKGKHSDILQNVRMFADNITVNYNGLSFRVQDTEFRIPVIGEFNIYNALAAISVTTHYGIPLDVCKKALEKVKVIPGRMEVVQKDPFLVVVDYAHTPVQLESMYRTLSSWTANPKSEILNPKSRQSRGLSMESEQILNHKSKISNLICVLGSCGGGRDKWKRPVLGQIAGKYCKEIIITNEDPYDEDPMEIIKQVASGIQNPTSNTQHLILDRKEAIKKAISLAKPEDTVIITGKGSESLMCIENGKKIPWDDREIAKEILSGKIS